MSRVGKKPVAIPAGVKVAVSGREITVEGPKGKLVWSHRPEVEVRVEGNEVHVLRRDESRMSSAFQGVARSLVQNMVTGVVTPYEKRLEVVGVGFVMSIKAGVLHLRVGYANEVKKPIPPGLTVTCPDQTHVLVVGCDKQKVGQFAAEVRSVRKPEPYKGKGVRYQGEFIKLKPGKTAT